MPAGERSNQRLARDGLWNFNTASMQQGSLSSQQPPRASCHGQQPNRIQALFFGYFLLGQQKKVTRPPGESGGLPPRHTNGGLPPRQKPLMQ